MRPFDRHWADILLRRWWILLLPVVLAAMLTLPELLRMVDGGGNKGFSAQLRYSAAQLLNLPTREGDYSDIWQASEYTVDALTNWVRSASFRDEIHAQLPADAPSLQSLGVAADNARSIGIITFSYPDAAALQQIVDAALLALSNSSQRYFPQLGGESAQVTILDSGTVHAIAPSLWERFAPLIRLGLALFVGLALALYAEVLDPTIYHPQELQRMGLPLRGSIPRQRRTRGRSAG